MGCRALDLRHRLWGVKLGCRCWLQVLWKLLLPRLWRGRHLLLLLGWLWPLLLLGWLRLRQLLLLLLSWLWLLLLLLLDWL